MYGEGEADKLFGGPGNDDLIGGPGRDTLSGGEDLDFYYFGDGWGKDTITDSSASSDGTASSQNMLMFVKGPSNEDAQVPVTDDLTIRLSSGDGPEVKNASGTTTINWAANFIQRVESGAGDDQITGNLVANVISANHGGADNLSSGGGNDRIDVADGSGDDVVDCGETLGNSSDNDTVFFDSGDQIAANCESQNPF